MKKYISTERNITARARSERLRKLGVSASNVTVSSDGAAAVNGTVTVTDKNSHTHANKADLDKLSVKDGYIDITENGTAADSDTTIKTTTHTKAGTADEAKKLTDDSENWNVIARKDKEETINAIYTFLKGVNFGEFVKDSTGGSIYTKDGNWYFEGDFFHVRKKFTAESVEIQHSYHIGGKVIQSAADMTCCKVEDKDTVYRCYFRKSDADGNVIYNKWRVKDQALCETNNLTTSAGGKVGNHYLWRLVTAVDDGTEDMCWIDISKTDCADESDCPMADDKIVQLGYRGTDADAKSRTGALILSGAGDEGAPYVRSYTSITSYTLPKPTAQISPNGSWITVTNADGDEVTVQDYINSLGTIVETIQTSLAEVKAQSDKQIVIWFGNEVPTATNEPASLWTDDTMKSTHAKDVYYNKSYATTGGGRAYSYDATDNVYGWKEITDADVLKSLEAASMAQTTADGKMRTFVDTPTPPYDAGDTWAHATYGTTYKDELLICKTAKAKGATFSIDDWELATKYTDDTAVTDLTKKLVDTGIDIESKKITATCPTFLIQDNNKNPIAVFKIDTTDGLPKLDVKYINADGITAKDVDLTGKITATSGTFTDVTAKNLTVVGLTATDGDFSGKLNGVTGSFKTLECVDANGNSAGSITFGSDQRITFNNADVNQQGNKNGRSLIFYAGDIRCRGSFGAYQHTMACVDGQYISYYVRGCDNITKYIRAKLPTTSYNNIVYCYVPLYPVTLGTYEVSDLTAFGDGLSTDEIYGFPIDILLMKNSANTSDANHYCLIGDYGKEVIIANVDDDQNPVYYARCGNSEAKLSGGTVQHLINAYYMNPSRTLNSIDKPTWMVCGEFDNDW